VKKLLLLIALLIGLSDGSIVIFAGSPVVLFTPKEIVVEGMVFEIKDIVGLRYVPDNKVM
jgi:hypothetical protein